jgi:hypothetical protein
MQSYESLFCDVVDFRLYSTRYERSGSRTRELDLALEGDLWRYSRCSIGNNMVVEHVLTRAATWSNNSPQLELLLSSIGIIDTVTSERVEILVGVGI